MAMKIALIDGANVCMRLAHAIAPGAGHANDPAVAELAPKIMGATEDMIRRFAYSVEASHAVVCLDSAESWRRELYPEYKGNRDTSTAVWNNRLATYCAERGLHVVRALGFEADDLIATLAARATRAGHSSAVLSSDGDLLMTASLSCEVYQFGKKGEPRFARRTMGWITERYELAHHGQLALLKALIGDTSDNLPGLDGIGPVKAGKLLKDHPTQASLLASQKLNVDEYERLKLMLTLVTPREDVPLDAVSPALCRLR